MEDEQYGSAQEEEEEVDLTLNFGHSGFVSRYVPPHSGEDEEHEEEEHTAGEGDGEVKEDEEEELNDLGAGELGEGEEEAGVTSQLQVVLSGPEQVVAGRVNNKKKTSKVRRQSKDKGEKVSTRL